MRLSSLLLSAVLVLPVAVSATPPAPGTDLGQIRVTGKTAAGLPAHAVKPVGPIQVISQQQIQASGLGSVGELLERLTITGSGINTTFNFRANGETCLSLRNLGCNHVLVLVNGRRWPTLITGETDLNTIPLAVVDHIEILKSGGSAEYGSGALAGVVNIVTRSGLDGSEARAYVGSYVEDGRHDGQGRRYEFTHGMSSPRSDFIFNASYTEQRPVTGGDRDITSFPNVGTGVTRGSSVTPQGRFIFINPNTGVTEDLTTITGTPGSTPADFRPFDKTADFYNFAPVNYLLTPSKRTGLYVQGRYDFSAAVSGHYTALYNDRRSQQQEGPAELSIGAQTANPISISASNPYNPFGFDLNAGGATPNLLLLAYQPVEIGPRIVTEDSQTFYFNAGLNGTFNLAARDFNWTLDAVINRNTMTTLDNSELNLVNVANALGPVSNCGAGTANPACVPLNVFGGQYNGGSITPAMAQYITYAASDYLETNERAYTATLSAPLVELPAGPLQATLGYDYLYESGLDQPDALAAAGESSAGANPPVHGAYHANAGWLDFKLPLLANVRWVDSLALETALRHGDYSSFGTLNSELATLNWVLNPRLTLAASWSQDFRAPDIAELYTASVAGSASVADPCSNYPVQGGDVAVNCAAAGVPAGYVQVNPDVPTTSGRNSGLKPETASSRTLSMDWQPFAETPFKVGADYFKTEINNAIGALNPQDVLNGCYVSRLADYCGFITRNASGAIAGLETGNFNLGTLLTEGMDFDANYTLQTAGFGQFEFNSTTTWVKRFTRIQPNLANPGAPIITQLVDSETGRPKAGYPRFKSQFEVDWRLNDWSIAWQLHYISDLSERCSDRYDGTPQSLTSLGLCSYPDAQNNALSRNKLGATTYHDLRVRYQFDGGRASLILGVLNIFDKQPPIAHSIGSFDTTLYRIPGRFPFLNLEYHF